MNDQLTVIRVEPDWPELRKLFPATKEWAWMNHAGISPISQPVADAMRGYLDRCLNEGSSRTWHGERVDAARAKAAGLIGASPQEVALVQNTGASINMVAQGLDWNAGDNVVMPEVEFPANYFPWANLVNRGVSLKLVPAHGGTVPVEDLLGAIDPSTRVVALSSVQFSNGYRSDLRRIGTHCRERGVLLSVDAIQELGALPMDVEAQCIDFLHAGTYKWILGPKLGIFYCRRDLIDRVRVTFVGHSSMAEGFDGVERADFLPYEWDLWPSARRFESGSPDYGLAYGLDAALQLLLEVGPEAIGRRILALTDYAIEGLRDRGCEVLSPLGAGERSGIVLFRSPRTSAAEVVQRFTQHRIRTVPRAGAVRICPHFYNTEEELDRVFALLP
jgi:selenocysteine lyase/cysteine desulfurase